ncbi:MAG: oligosaccharide flippase family protein [Actinobacteria bacterium]|nr:oligosaccharide flippase family protein [Actinomycetota bacterium]
MTVSADTGTPDVSDPATRTSDMRRLARGSGVNLAGSLVAAALNLVLPVVVTRGLAAADAGIFFQTTALFTILLNVGTIGADTGVLRSLPRALALGRATDLGPILKVALWPAVALSTALAIVLALLAGPIAAAATGGDTDAARAFSTTLLILSPVLPVAVCYLVTMAATRGLGSLKPLVLIEKLGRNALQVAAVAVVVITTGSLSFVIAAWVLPYLAASLVVAAWTWATVRRLQAVAPEPDSSTPPSAGLAREFWGFSAPRALSRVFSVALQRFDIIIVGALRGPQDAALYAVATRFPILGLMFVQAIQQVMAPRISQMHALGDSRRTLELYRTTTAWLTLVSWPIYLISVCFAGLLLDVFGAGYDEATPVVVILCLTMLVATACGPVDSVLLMGGRSVLSLLNTGLALTVTVVLDLVLIPRYGITGAAVGWSLGILVNNLLPLWQVKRTMGMHPFGVPTVCAMGLTLVAYGCVPAVVRLLAGDGVLPLVVAGALATGVFVLGGFWARRPLELDRLVAAIRRRHGDEVPASGS